MSLEDEGWTPTDEQKPTKPGYYEVCEMGNHIQKVYYLPEFDWWMALTHAAREVVVTHWRQKTEETKVEADD
jgi:hypothetical protein